MTQAHNDAARQSRSAPAPVAHYLRVWLALLGLLVLTFVSAYLPLDGLHASINLGVAVVKALLVLLFFMHLHTASPPLRIFAAIGFAWLMLLLVLSMTDYLMRATA